MTVRLDALRLCPGALVVDVGAGSGRHALAVALAGHRAVAVDIDGGSLIQAKAHAEDFAREIGQSGGSMWVVRGDVRDLPFTSSSVDAVICSEVLEHVVDLENVYPELVRILRPGGVLAASVPRSVPEALYWGISREYHAAKGGHIRIFRRSGLEAQLRRSGLALIGRHHAHALHTPLWLAKCLFGIEPSEPSHRLAAACERIVVREIMGESPMLTSLEHVLDPVMGKSLVLYGTYEERESA
ncbi:MAG: class I SAM-dependent methyltransferase [Acidimicrobiales bacterium]